VEDQWSVRDDDRPLLRPQASRSWPLVAGVAAIAAAGGALYYYLNGHRAEPPAAPPAPPAAQSAPAPQSSAPQPAPSARLEAPEANAQTPLPSLDESDSMMRQSLANLIGRKAFDEAVNPSQLIRNIVATVDNLPRPTAPRRVMPLNPVPGAFGVTANGDAAVLDPANSARYAPYVRVLESVNTKALVYSYVQAYPLFQQAYEQLGFPGKYFNDRLLGAIDDMLAAPELDGPVRLLRPKVVYEFADPDLQARSAGQKIMMRMGSENELAVKAKLREIRQEIVRRSRQAR
jgi:hypothetical protein